MTSETPDKDELLNRIQELEEEVESSDLQQEIEQLKQQVEEATQPEPTRAELIHDIGNTAGLEDTDYMDTKSETNADFRKKGLKKLGAWTDDVEQLIRYLRNQDDVRPYIEEWEDQRGEPIIKGDQDQ